MTDRQKVIAGVLARAAGKKVFGFTSLYGSCARLDSKGKGADAVLWDWEFICVEGDAEWTRMPRGQEPPAKAKKAG